MSKTSATRTISTFLKGAAVAAAFGSASLLSAPAFASDPRVVQGIQHYIECFGLMVTDPVAHSANCLPNPSYVPFSTPASGFSTRGNAPAPTTVPDDNGKGPGKGKKPGDWNGHGPGDCENGPVPTNTSSYWFGPDAQVGDVILVAGSWGDNSVDFLR